jgi:TolB-like protein/tRNA A-37 threonylcarbamoyl transferase component Bud32/Flp pilus assembly protein TadD
MELPATTIATCSTCHAEMTAKGECLACLLRGGLEEPASSNGSPESLTFGDFEIARREDGSFWELGCGAMGVTYRAVDKVLHRTVALKVVETPAVAEKSRSVRERFLREARAAAALKHPNVASIFQFGASAEVDRCYYAMELVEGETLEALVRRDGAVKVEVALEIAIQVTRALIGAAAQGLIHRDLKPGNIMLTHSDAATGEIEVKVIDFGLAKATNAVVEMDLTHGGFVGTPSFASPEQFGSAPADARSDIYSLGVTLWYALTAGVPYPGKTIEEIRDRQQHSDLPIEQLTERNIPIPLIDLLRRTLALDPTQRPGSAREMLSALESCRSSLALPKGAIQRQGPRKLATLLVTTTIAAAILVTFLLLRQKTPATAPPALLTEKSIAVLPLENLSTDKENAFFADGIQDDILTSLAKISDFKIISRTSVSQYRGAGAIRNLREIGRELGVVNILEGSVRREGNRVLVNVQLIDARNDRHLWAERYDRTLADSIGLQGEVAAEIAAALRAKLAPEEKASLAAKPTENPEAYTLYLNALGREGAVNHSTEDLIAAEQLYAQAIALDPKFALAHARLSIAQSQLGYDAPDDRRVRARAAADEALRLAPSLGEAHTALGLSMYYFDKDYAAALKEFSVAAATSPNEPDILRYIAGIQRRQGLWRESLATFQRAQDLDPRNQQIITWAALNRLLVRDWPGATACYNRAREIAPDSAYAKVGLAYLEVFQNGNPAAGRKILQNIPSGIDPDGVVTGARWDLAMLERDYARAEKILTDFPLENFPNPGDAPKTYYQGRLALARGDIEGAQRYFAAATPVIEKCVHDNPNDPNPPAQLGLLYAFMHRKEDAIREGRRAVEMEPESQNAFHGAARAANLALVYALVSEPDQAITLIERLLSTPGPVQWPDFPSNITLADLRLRWEWDSLRSNPRFQKLLAQPEPKTVLTQIPQAAPAVSEKSIAVLPFENLSNDEANASFAAGVQDELLSDLARIADLKVISRTSVMKYKNTERNLRDIGRALGVAHIVEGSVQRVGNRVRVNAQLVDTRTDAHLWAQTYDGELVDIFGIQSEIAQRIADQLRAKISPTERAAILEQPTTDLTAYALYTEAKAASGWADWKKERIKPRLLELLHEAIRRDPNFVLAYCFLAEVYSHEHGTAQRTGYESGAVDELWKQAIDNAMRLRPDMGEPHLALARYHFLLNQFDASRDELAIARRLLPNNSDAIFIAARIDRRQNRWEESLAGVRKAHELDPRNPDIIAWTCEMYWFMRRYSEGEQFVSEAMARMPEITSFLNVQLAEFKLREGDPRAAQEIVARVPPATGGGEVRFKTALYLRDYDTAAKAIATAPAEEAEEDFHGKPPRSRADGQLARARGDNAAAQAAFLGAREDWENPAAHHRRDERYFAEIALLDAGLGRKQEAIREAQHAVELLPISKDALFGPDVVQNQAWVYAWTGEPNLAIEKLEMLSKIPVDVSYGDLRFNPCWDSLRGDSRFEKVVNSLKPNAMTK